MSYFCIFYLILIFEVSAIGTPTDYSSCKKCYLDNNIHCINESFDNSVCCTPGDQKCIEQYKYCTSGLKTLNYKLLTCPMNNCPDTKGIFHEITQMNVKETFFKSWPWFTSAQHCKMVFSADKLNGKLVVKLLNVNDANVHIFKMPKNFNERYGYHGLFENNDLEINQETGGVYEAPSDWIIIVSYNHIWDWTDGNLRVQAWVEEYDEQDMKIDSNGGFKMTGAKGLIQDKW